MSVRTEDRDEFGQVVAGPRADVENTQTRACVEQVRDHLLDVQLPDRRVSRNRTK
ncbi:hypothetical protein JOF29_000491 [Kribbella aluminosa]|uniref:Uncharacterized protein n=1 Tax=Kribbella aluminosa TaxID=416017 RepID=A0ABS4UCN9_9ACTN|nr:hypothetical protein [Kribbella aluminosa]MBP2349408.1 hypothetical protein [Kribbella aluminosa]